MSITFSEISGIPLFRKIQERDFPLLLQYFEVLDLEAGVPLIESGKLNDTLFVILSGEMERKNASSTNLVLKVGEFLGAKNIFLPAMTTEEAKTLSSTRLLALSALHLRDFVEQCPQLAADIVLQLSERLAHQQVERTQAFDQDLKNPQIQHFENTPGINRSQA